MNKGLCCLLLLCSFSLSALTLEQLQQQLTTQKVLRGDFTQSKSLQMFKQPLLSDGTFLLSHEQGLIWQQNNPFPVSLVLAKDKLRQQFSGKEAEIIEAKDNPMVFYFSHLFLSLFKGDLSSLESQFSMQLSDDGKGNWLLNLTPKKAPLDKVFKSIKIQGKEQIKSLTLTELNTDSSLITFSNISEQQAPLTQQEKDAFKF
ncbi:outer membrane lipoprotein carrier protein LolA [Psychromonas sp. RZ22]|nr:outer membrane lipoprotein carrier protein LolA [Psychromonas sp. RZ22]